MIQRRITYLLEPAEQKKVAQVSQYRDSLISVIDNRISAEKWGTSSVELLYKHVIQVPIEY